MKTLKDIRHQIDNISLMPAGTFYRAPVPKKRKRRGVRVARKVKSYVSGAIRRNKEQKGNRTAPTLTYAAGGAGSLALLNSGITQGDNVANRDGNEIILTGMEIRNNVNMAATTTGQGTLRLLIVYDTQPTGALPTITDVMNADSWAEPFSTTNGAWERFRVLYDGYRDMNDIGQESVHFVVKKKLNHGMTFNTTTGNIADIRKGAIYALTWCSVGNYAVADPTSLARCVFYFKDK